MENLRWELDLIFELQDMETEDRFEGLEFDELSECVDEDSE